MKTQLIIKDKIILHNLNPKLMITSCEFKDINLDNIEESVFASQLRNLQDSESYEDEDSNGVEFVNQEEYDQQGYDEGDDDCFCFEYEQEEDAMERPEATKATTSRRGTESDDEDDDEECSYESSSTDTDSDEINIEILLICNNNKNVNANESMIEKAMELEDIKSTKSNIFPPEKMCFWFGNEEQEQMEEIFKIYTEYLHPQNHLKNYRRGAQSYVASIKREPIVPINKSNSFQTLDTILIFRKDLNIPNGVSFPITNILFSLTNWNIQEGIPTNVDIISCQQRFSDIKTLRVATNIKPSFLSCLPLSENLQNEHHYMVSNQFIDITRDTSNFKTNYHQKYFPFRNYEDGKGIFFDVRQPLDQSNPLLRDL